MKSEKTDLFFVTGMARSGTTLLQKLLNNHKNLSALDQAFPLTFIEAKKEFLIQKGIDKYFVLNDDSSSRSFSLDSFSNDFLPSLSWDKDKLHNIVESQQKFSGARTELRKSLNEIALNNVVSFYEIYDQLLHLYSELDEIKKLGNKEIMCEEFIPYFTQNNVKCILILRDPRDVIASANYPKKDKFLGDKRPTLLLIRAWRKSVEIAHQQSENENLHVLKYEDLVKNTKEEINKICQFLNTEHINDEFFKSGILDEKGDLWKANSSKEDDIFNVSSESVGKYHSILSQEEINYIEATCFYEMKYLNYGIKINEKKRLISIESFKDNGTVENHEISADYTSLPSNIEIELKRKPFYGV